MPNPRTLSPSDTARSKRVAAAIAAAVRTAMPRGHVSGIDVYVRGVASHLKSHRFKLRQLDSENGTHAIHAVVTALPAGHFRQLGADNTRQLGRLWDWVTHLAQRNLRERYIQDEFAHWRRA